MKGSPYFFNAKFSNGSNFLFRWTQKIFWISISIRKKLFFRFLMVSERSEHSTPAIYDHIWPYMKKTCFTPAPPGFKITVFIYVFSRWTSFFQNIVLGQSNVKRLRRDQHTPAILRFIRNSFGILPFSRRLDRIRF